MFTSGSIARRLDNHKYNDFMETTMLNQFMNSFPDFLFRLLGGDLSATDGLVEGRDFARAGRSHNLVGWSGKSSGTSSDFSICISVV